MLISQSVSELNRQIGALIETTFLHVKVEGEVSRPTYHSSGHLYFTLKDENSTISCVMFKGNVSKVKFKIEDGMKIILDGSISTYIPRGTYNINVIHLQPNGTGALAIAYEQLKKKLLQKGYFESKKSIPRSPSHVSIVTSSSGAVLQDMLNVAKKRWPLLKITLISTIVQGENAKDEIVNAIKIADKLDSDVMIVARGGGSVEDLWAFNEEIVADAIYNAKTPVVSAIGHEIDTVISDFVADLRAPTPSAAMELILPDKNEFLQNIDFFINQFNERMMKTISQKKEQLENFFELYKKNSYDVKIEIRGNKLTNLKELYKLKLEQIFENKTLSLHVKIENLHVNMQNKLNQKNSQYESLLNTYKLQEPNKENKEGYAQVVKDGKKISLENLKKDDEFELQNIQIKIKSKVLDIKKI